MEFQEIIGVGTWLLTARRFSQGEKATARKLPKEKTTEPRCDTCLKPTFILFRNEVRVVYTATSYIRLYMYEDIIECESTAVAEKYDPSHIHRDLYRNPTRPDVQSPVLSTCNQQDLQQKKEKLSSALQRCTMFT